MQLFSCPFCGLRNEREFRFAGEAGKVRPDTTVAVDAASWAAYQYTQRNEKGEVREIWSHMPCSEMFVMVRDSVSMEVLGTVALRKDQP